MLKSMTAYARAENRSEPYEAVAEIRSYNSKNLDIALHLARPFLPRIQPVDPGKLFLFGILSYVVISQGSSLMQNVESWRSDAGSYMYQQ